MSIEFPQWIDARFTDVVQSFDKKAENDIRLWLKEQDLYSTRVSPRTFGEQRWLIDIDGNVNSWGLLWKLFSGSCVLRIASNRRQWFHHRLCLTAFRATTQTAKIYRPNRMVPEKYQSMRNHCRRTRTSLKNNCRARDRFSHSATKTNVMILKSDR